jgi:acyl-CoA thioesterase
MTRLEDSLALAPNGEGIFEGISDPTYEANTGMFGGWTAALLLRAALAAPGAEGSVSSLTVSFLNRIAPGAKLRLRPQRLGGGKSMTHWRCDLFLEDGGDLAASAHMVLTHRKPGDARSWLAMPDSPGPEHLPVFNPPNRFGARFDIHFVEGGEPFATPGARTLAWERTTTPGPMDAVRLAMLSDLGWPRAWALGQAPRASSTLSLSLYVLATPEELAAVGEDYILSEMVATRAEQSTVGSRKSIWSRAGVLLATSEQLCWFR